MFIQQKSDILSLGYFHEEIHIAKFTCQYKKKNVKVKVVQSCPNLCDPMNYTVHGILWPRDWVAFSFSRGSS